MPITANRESTIRVGLILILAILVGVAGALPHLFFHHDLGGETFFEGAWDESFYALAMAGEIADWNSYPVRYLAETLLTATDGPSPLFAILSDVIWPALVMLAAGVLVLMHTRGTIAVVPAVFLIVFASDILGFNSSVIHDSANILSYTLRDLPIEIRRIFSDPYVTFLYIYRTPEPQLSLPIFLIYLAAIARFMRLAAPRGRDWLIVVVVSLVSINVYTFFAVGGLMVGAAGGVCLALVRRWGQAGGLLAITALCGVWLGSRLLSSHAGEASAMVFSSSLPMFAPSMIYGGILAISFAFSFRRSLAQNPALIFALCCFLLPFATLNQQVITGVMVQTLNWERYVNFPCLVLGFLLFAERIDWFRIRERAISRFHQLSISFQIRRLPMAWAQNGGAGRVATLGAKATLVVFLFFLSGQFLYKAQLNNYRQFVRYNVLTTGYARLIDKVRTTRPDAPRRIILANMAYDASVRARAKTPGVVINGYTSLVASLDRPSINSAEVSHNEQTPSVYQIWGFDYAAGLGLTAQEYEQRLKTEIDAGACWPHLMFEATFLECAPYVSDFRAYFPEELKQRVSSIGKRYRHYLLKAKERSIGESLVLRTELGEASDPNGLWRQEPIGSVKLSTAPNGYAPSVSVELFAYWQKPNNPSKSSLK